MSRDMLRLRPYQTKALDTIRASFDHVRRQAVVIPTGGGKGHTPDTEVPTPDGVRKWGDLRLGDLVFGSDGRPTEVLAVYDRGEIPAYRVTFSDGASIVVDGDHLWAVHDHKYRRTPREVRTLSTSEILAEGLRHGRSHRFNVPMTVPVARTNGTLPVDPYTLGALIANGSLTGAGTQLSTPDDEAINRVRLAHVANKIKDTTAGVCARYSLPGLSRHMRDLGLNVLSAEKHLPTPYLEAPVADRVALLQGLMDGDGSSRGGGRRVVQYHTTSPGLVADVVELVTSLGGTAKPKWSTRVREDRPVSVECSVSILLPSEISPFHSGRKIRDEQPRRMFEPRRAVVSVTPVGHQPISCIRVAAADHLYLVTRHHIVTHNTVIFAHLADEWVRHEHARHHLPARVLVLADRDELVNQAVDKLRQVAPGMDIGVIKAARNDTAPQLIVASLQTLAREGRRAQLPPVGLVIVDECDVAVTSYRAILEHVGCFYDGPHANLKARAVGVTATLARNGRAGADLGDVWEEVVYRLDILDLIEQGYLVDVVGRRVTVNGLTWENVTVRNGDFAAGSLSEALMTSDAMRVTADAYLEHAKDLSGVVFTPNVESAQAFAEEFRGRGLTTEPVWGAMPVNERRRVLAAFAAGDVQVITNCAVLTRGWDAPIASCAVIARPTLSASLYIQMCGRILRPYPGKTQALVLDVAGASENHQLATLADLTSRRMEEVPEGESLTVAVLKEIADGNPYLSNYTVDSYEVDLFRRSEALWLQTNEGIWFTNTKERLYFLWPGSEPGLYKAGWRPIHSKGGGWIASDVPFGIAQEWAEQEALRDDADNNTIQGASLARKNASWRQGRQPAGDAQIGYAERLKLTVAEGMTKREVGDMISVELASRALDKPIKATR